ncbi:hypothetical protein BC938DRAFT_480101, partial [Jimgerdemannia flammicorona]
MAMVCARPDALDFQSYKDRMILPLRLYFRDIGPRCSNNLKASFIETGSTGVELGDLDQPRLSNVTARLKESHRDTDPEIMDLPPD